MKLIGAKNISRYRLFFRPCRVTCIHLISMKFSHDYEYIVDLLENDEASGPLLYVTFLVPASTFKNGVWGEGTQFLGKETLP